MTATRKDTKSAPSLTFESIGENVEAAVSNKVLFLRIDLSAKGSTSASGKSQVIGSTRGNAKLAEAGVTVGLNCYKPVASRK